MQSSFLNFFTLGVVAIIGMMFFEKKNNDLTYVQSPKDGRRYLVRNLPDRENAANLMASIRENLVTMRDYLSTEQRDDSRVVRLLKKFNPDNMMETQKGSKYTSYSVNKGEKLVFCMRSKDSEEKLTDLNTITFVALHELAHIMTKSIGHTEEFWKNFKYLLQLAVRLGIYKKIDYSANPQLYCGMKVTDSPLVEQYLNI